jgi:hypothetical protein
MLNNYTKIIAKGGDFRTFVTECAKVFSNQHWDSELPEKFEPDRHHKDARDTAWEKIEALNGMTAEERERAESQDKHNKELRYAENLNKRASLRYLYLSMLKEVTEWTGPGNLRAFMIKQITDGLEYDCFALDWTSSAKDWYTEQYENLVDDFEYHRGKYEEELERVQKENEWLAKLRSSL